MIDFIKENFGTIVVGLAVLICVAAIISKMIRDRKKGKCISCDSCSGCPSSSFCHASTDNKKP